MDILQEESLIRISFFSGGLILFGALGLIFKFRTQMELRSTRWINNIALTLFNTVLVRLVVPSTVVALALFTDEQNWGLFHIFGLSPALNVFVSFFLLDCVIFFQHMVFHYTPILWRLHQVHHSDTGFDVTTALRFHPIEILLSLGIKAAVIVVFGVNATAVIVFEVLLNFSAMFNHSNFRLPPRLESAFRKLIVTPDMHRIHHSVIVKETHSNFGFFLSWWDRLFGTYIDKSKVNLQVEKIGVPRFREQRDQRLDQLLLQPFYKNK